eukprot:CAMPEP_0196150924 /NCGR_PEP_ID=MMETSP0910-20130528/32655_1 /TAXON_ID=49265 /ORGANISM="Thalassiosira rotula, Strain GSO102" /LENGTH=73 /DNA_ID=CAMNT_0041414165 /DNA_START=125 /DNA_END=346 /DNA_ORIENTATION=-
MQGWPSNYLMRRPVVRARYLDGVIAVRRGQSARVGRKKPRRWRKPREKVDMVVAIATLLEGRCVWRDWDDDDD